MTLHENTQSEAEDERGDARDNTEQNRHSSPDDNAKQNRQSSSDDSTKQNLQSSSEVNAPNKRPALLKITLTKSKARFFAGVAFTLGCVVLLVLFPQSGGMLYDRAPLPAGLFFPLFLLGVLISLFVDFSTKSKAVVRLVKIVALLLCFLVILYLSEILGSRHLWPLPAANPLAFLYGLGIIAAIWAFIFALGGSASWSLRITTLVVLLYGLANHITLTFRGTPFIPQDVFGLGTAGDVASSYSFVFTYELAAALMATAGIFLVAPRLKSFSLKNGPKWLLRVAALVASIAFFALTVTKPFIVSLNLEPFYFEQWQSAQRNGSLVNFVANIADAGSEAPEGYTRETAADIAARYTSDSAQIATVKPDVIVILGESWADITPAGRVSTNQPVMPFISSFQERDDTSYGYVIVSSKGGGTSRQEFQFLTGANDVYGLHTAPFLFLVDEQLPSIVSSFNLLDYRTVALHPGAAGAWNRNTALPAMGFDDFYTAPDLWSQNAPTLRTYLRDSVMYDKTLELLDNADEPMFIYAITLQTHGGYAHDDFTSTIHITQPQGSYKQTEQFLTLLNESDKDFEAFIAALADRERPTLVLFFGDHLPNFENSYYDDVFDGSDPIWRYQAIYGAWANYDLPELSFADNTPISLSYLNLYLMQAAGLPLTGYQKFLIEGAEEYPVSSIVGFRRADGSSLTVDEARQTQVFKQQAIMQYSFVYDRAYIPEEFFFLRP